MILNFKLGTFPSENCNILSFEEENCFLKWQFPAEDFCLAFEKSNSNEIFDLVDTKFIFRLEFLNLWINESLLCWPNYFIHLN